MASIQTSVALFLAHVILLLGLPASLVGAVPVSPHVHHHKVLVAARPSDSSNYWVANVKRQGVVPFGSNANYQVFRNVKDFGATGMYSFLIIKIKTDSE